VRAVEGAAVLSAVDGRRVTRRVQLRVAQVRVQLVDNRRTHPHQVEPADAAAAFHVEQVQYLDRRQALQRNPPTVA